MYLMIKAPNLYQLGANDNEKETIGLTIYCAEDEDIRVELFYALAKAECPVIELNKLDTSLEDAFLALTRGGSKQYGGRKLKKLKSGHKNEKENLLNSRT